MLSLVNEVFSGEVQKPRSDKERDRTARHYEFFAALYKSDKTFPVVLGFMYLGLALGFIVMAVGLPWVGGCIMAGWFLLMVYLMTGAWQ